MGDVSAPDPVDAYLDALFDALSGTGAAGRRLMAEAEDHLRDATAAGRADGLTERAAQERAVDRFGRPEQVAAALSAERGRWSMRQLAGAAAVVGIVGSVVLGVSGLVSELVGDLGSRSFVAGDPPGVVYTAQRCADYLRLVRGAGSCSAAALEDHFGEVVEPRVAVGVLGLLALGVLIASRRRAGTVAWWPPLRLVALVGIVPAALVAAADLVEGALRLLSAGPDHGPGAVLADGTAAALAVAGFAVVLWRQPGRTTSPVR